MPSANAHSERARNGAIVPALRPENANCTNPASEEASPRIDGNRSSRISVRLGITMLLPVVNTRIGITCQGTPGRMNPTTSLTQEQAQKWWDFIGSTMIERGELSPKLKPFPDVFDLSLQPL